MCNDATFILLNHSFLKSYIFISQNSFWDVNLIIHISHVFHLAPGSLQPPKVFSRNRATSRDRWSCSFPAATCTPKGSPSSPRPRGHWVTGSPRMFIIPGEKMKRRGKWNACCGFVFWFFFKAELTCVSKVKRLEEWVVMFGSHSGMWWVQENTICAK